MQVVVARLARSSLFFLVALACLILDSWFTTRLIRLLNGKNRPLAVACSHTHKIRFQNHEDYPAVTGFSGFSGTLVPHVSVLRRTHAAKKHAWWLLAWAD